MSIEARSDQAARKAAYQSAQGSPGVPSCSAPGRTTARCRRNMTCWALQVENVECETGKPQTSLKDGESEATSAQRAQPGQVDGRLATRDFQEETKGLKGQRPFCDSGRGTARCFHVGGRPRSLGKAARGGRKIKMTEPLSTSRATRPSFPKFSASPTHLKCSKVAISARDATDSQSIRKSVERGRGGVGVLAARAQEVGERDRERLPVVREGGDLTAGGREEIAGEMEELFRPVWSDLPVGGRELG